MWNPATRAAAPLTVALVLAIGVLAPAADEPKPVPQRPRLNPIDPARLWQSIGPAVRVGRMPEPLEQIQSNISTAPRPANQPGGWYHAGVVNYTWKWLAARHDPGERFAVARNLYTLLYMIINILIDETDDRVGHAYSGMPDRLYLIDRGGRVAFKGGRGPFGYEPGELEQSIVMLLPDQEEARRPRSSAPIPTGGTSSGDGRAPVRRPERAK